MGGEGTALSRDDQYVVDLYNATNLTSCAWSALPLPPATSPIVISVVKDERSRLLDFMRHYREGGVERFVFIDNGSRDGTIDFLAQQMDVDLYRVEQPFDWRRKQAWINRAIDMYGLNQWYICVDADEHICFDGFGERSFSDLAVEMEERRITRIRGTLVDMYSDLPLLSGDWTTEPRLVEAYPFFDRSGYVEERIAQLISRIGGPRKRVFGPDDVMFKPQLTKYPMFRFAPGEFMVSPHYIWPYGKNFHSPCYLGLLHFNFHGNVLQRVMTAVEANSYWNESMEYKHYLRELHQDPCISFLSDESERFRSPEDLIACGLIERISWSKSERASPKASWTQLMRKAARFQKSKCVPCIKSLPEKSNGPRTA